MSWIKPINQIRPSMFRIGTPSGRGTGFQLFLSDALCGVATALHVIEHAHEWEDPIRMVHHSTGSSRLLRPPDRAIFTYPGKDLAFILFAPGDLDLKESEIELIEADKRMKQGVEFGWCGFPAVSPGDLCFFTGHVSSWLTERESYLIDGVAINGVSGGPAFTKDPKICGVVTAYIPNRATGESLPGVCLIEDVASYHKQLKDLKSVEEAQAESEPPDEPADDAA